MKKLKNYNKSDNIWLQTWLQLFPLKKKKKKKKKVTING